MKNKLFLILIFFMFLNSCVGTSSTGIFGTGVTVALDPRTLGTQIDDSIMDKSLDAKLLSIDKSYILNVKTKILDGRIFITGKVDTVEEKLNITKMAWEIKGARSVKNDLKIKDEFNFKQSAKDILITSQLKSALIFKKTTTQTLKILEKHDAVRRIDSIWKIWGNFTDQNARTGFLHILPKADCQKNNLFFFLRDFPEIPDFLIFH